MDKKCNKYVSPDTGVRRIAVESSICGGSITVANPNDESGRINDQEFNTDFSGNLAGGGWDEAPSN